MSDCRILVADELTPEALEILSTAGEVVQKKGLKPADLARELPPYHALVVRSATQVDAEGLGGAQKPRRDRPRRHRRRQHRRRGRDARAASS